MIQSITMDDLSLEALQAALVSVQEEKTTTRLSERNIVELVNKLQEVGLLETGLLHSIQGKEYITPDQLCIEIEHAVADAGGRLAMADLPARLGVDLAHCERQAQRVVESSSAMLQIIQSELMTDAYFDGIAAEVGDLLEDTGVAAIGDLARRFKLGAELMHETIAARAGSLMGCHLESGILYTAMHIAKVKSQLRGALRGASRPVNLAALSKSLDLITTGSSGKMVQSTVEELVSEQAVFGTLKASTFVPSIFAKAQQQAVQDFYSQNGFIELEMLERMGVHDPATYMASAHSDCKGLEAIFISPQLIAQLSAAAEEAISADQWMDAQANLPTAVGDRDAAALLQQAYPDQSKGKVLAGTCLISSSLLENLRERSRVVAKEAADLAMKSRRASAKSASTSAPAGLSAGRQGDSKKKTAAAAADSDDEDDWDAGRAGSKKKKGSKRKSTAKQKASATAQGQTGKAKQGPPGGSTTAASLSLQSLALKVEEWLPEAVGCGEDEAFSEAVAAELRPAALAEFEAAQAAVFLAGAEARRKKRDAISKAVDEAGLRFQLYASGAEFVKEDESTHSAIKRHLLRSVGQKIADLLLRCHEVDLKEEDETSTSDRADYLEPVPPAERNHLYSLLPADVASSMTAADKTLNTTDTDLAWGGLLVAANAAGLQLRKLDKKGEKGLLAEHKAVLADRLKGLDQPAEALSLAVPLLVAQIAGKAITVPGKALAGVIGHLKDAVPPDSLKHLTDLHRLVVQDLRAQSNEQNPDMALLLQKVKLIVGIEQDRESSRAAAVESDTIAL